MGDILCGVCGSDLPVAYDRIAQLEDFLDELRNDLSLDEATKYLVRINKVLGENEEQDMDTKGNRDF